MAKAGRPKANIDWEIVRKCFRAQCSVTEVAGKLGIDTDTLYKRCQQDLSRNISELSAECKQKGQADLRISMFESAENGSNTMQIWLSKNYLGMKDQTETKTDISLRSPIEVKLTADDTRSDPIG